MAAGASARHCTGMTNWPNPIQCLGQDAIMALGIKSFATEGVHDQVHDKVHDKGHDKVHSKVHEWYQDLGTKNGGTALSGTLTDSLSEL